MLYFFQTELGHRGSAVSNAICAACRAKMPKSSVNDCGFRRCRESCACVSSCSLKPPGRESSTPPRRYWQRSKISVSRNKPRTPRRQSQGNDEADRKSDRYSENRSSLRGYVRAVARQIRQQRGNRRTNRSPHPVWRVRRSAWAAYRRRRQRNCRCKHNQPDINGFLAPNLSGLMPKGSCSRACVSP